MEHSIDPKDAAEICGQPLSGTYYCKVLLGYVLGAMRLALWLLRKSNSQLRLFVRLRIKARLNALRNMIGSV